MLNQDHILILKTLKEIKHEYKKEILVLSTGIFYDYRHPRHNRFIKEYIYKNNFTSRGKHTTLNTQKNIKISIH